jgi:hypothetical protein
VKPTLSAWVVTGVFLAALIAVIVFSYSPTPNYMTWVVRFVVALVALITLYLQSDQARRK